MNAEQLNKINNQLESVVSSTLRVLMTDELDVTTVNLPVPTLHAFMSIVVGLVELIPDIHKSEYHRMLSKLAENYLDLSIQLENTLLLEDLYDIDSFKLFKTNFITHIDQSLVTGEKSFGVRNNASIAYYAMNLPELANQIQEQKRELDMVVRTPLATLFNQISGELQANAQRKGYTVTRAECITTNGIREPTVYWTSKITARQLRDSSINTLIRPGSTQSTQSPKRIRLSDSQYSDEML